MNKDFHFHYFPQYHEGYKSLVGNVCNTSILLLHGSQMKMPNFLPGLESFRGIFNLGIELSVSDNLLKVQEDVEQIRNQNYEVIISIHTYKDFDSYMRILTVLQPIFPLIHHLGHPLHKEKHSLLPEQIRTFIEFCKTSKLAVELNERYSRQYNVEFYNCIKTDLTWYPSTDAHEPSDVIQYRKMTKYSIL
jgi:histidinol phosphatase-like PHP family hydrolase